MTMQDVYGRRRKALSAQTDEMIRQRGPHSLHDKLRLEALLDEADSLDHIERRDGQAEAFRSFLLSGEDVPSAPQGRLREMRDMSTSGIATGAATGPGVLVPVDFYAQVQSAERDFSPLIRLATIIDSPNARNLPVPTDLDAATFGEMLPEGSQATEADINNPSQVIFGGYKVSSKIIKISRELLTDLGINWDPYLARQFGLRMARTISQYGTTGTGSSGQPTGFLNAPNAINAGVAVGSIANDLVGGPNTLGTIDVTTLLGAIDPIYRDRSSFGFMVHADTLLAMQAQLDRDGRPLWPGLHNSPDGINRILNRPVYTNPFLAPLPTVPQSPPASYRCIAAADFSRVVIRRAPLVVFRLTERFAEFDTLGFLAMQRVDSNVIDQGACCAYLTTQY
jgi:HK97 family phage major capsid protein